MKISKRRRDLAQSPHRHQTVSGVTILKKVDIEKGEEGNMKEKYNSELSTWWRKLQAERERKGMSVGKIQKGSKIET